MKIYIRTPSRLHFGLLSWTDAKPRAFGGAGLMIEEPHIELIAEAASDLRVFASPTVAGGEAENRTIHPLSSSLISAAELQRLSSQPSPHEVSSLWHPKFRLNGESRTIPEEAVLERVRKILAGQQPLAVEVLSSPSEHSGLGTGTQLTLAVAVANRWLSGSVHYHHDFAFVPVEDLAIATGRGKRSAIGVHGFQNGGFLVDGGFSKQTKLAPLVARCDFPPHWAIVLIRPKLPPGLHGPLERQAFSEQSAISEATADRLCRLLLTGMLPAIHEFDHAGFSEALYEYNYKVGECFSFAQSGPYAHPRLAEIVRTTRSLGIAGVGQSSWGPTLFAICENPDQGQWLCDQLFSQLSVLPSETMITAANNSGFCMGEVV